MMRRSASYCYVIHIYQMNEAKIATILRIQFPSATGGWAKARCLLMHAEASFTGTGAGAKAWCLLIHAEEACLPLYCLVCKALHSISYGILPVGSRRLVILTKSHLTVGHISNSS